MIIMMIMMVTIILWMMVTYFPYGFMINNEDQRFDSWFYGWQ